MLEPQSSALFFLLLAAFGALMWWMLRTGWVAVRVLAACLAFTIATTFGVMAVNRFYGYYETWGAALGDITNQGLDSAIQVPGSGLPRRSQLDARHSAEIFGGLASGRDTLCGWRSRVSAAT
jgi:uncharacterized SAM-binding protein YcdF (DUF218 family)